MRAELEVRNATLTRSQSLVHEYESIKKSNERIEDMAQSIEELLRSGPVMRDLVALLDESKSRKDWITMVSDADMYFEREYMLASRARHAPEKHGRRHDAARERDAASLQKTFDRIVVEGYTPVDNLSTVKELIAKLAKAEFIESVDLMGDDKLIQDPDRDKKWANTAARRFVLDIKVMRP